MTSSRGPGVVPGLYLALAASVGVLAGLVALLQQAGVLPDLFVRQATRIHSTAMLLFVAVPALVGGFGRLFLQRDLTRRGDGQVRLPMLRGLDVTALLLTFLALVVFLGGQATAWATAAGLLVWCCGVTLMATGVVVVILDSRAGPGCVSRTGEDVGSHTAPFSLFVWTQFVASVGLLLTAPVLAAVATGNLLGHSGLPLAADACVEPVVLVVLVAASGLAGRSFRTVASPAGKTTHVAALLSAVTVDGGAAVWAHDMLTHQDPAVIARTGTALAAVTSLMFVVLWVRALWREAVTLRSVGVPALWMSGFFVLLVAGWSVQPAGGNGLHAAVLGGVVLALMGAFYSWLDDAARLRYAPRLAIGQFALFFAGLLLSAAGGTGTLATVGSGLMALSLVALLLALTMRSNAQAALVSGKAMSR